MLERDPDLLAHLEGCREGPFEGAVHRVVWADKSPVQGSSGARGRWSSPDSQFEVLNTSLMPEGANAEFEAFWSLFEQRPDRQALNWKLHVRLKRAVELDFGVLETLRVEQSDYGGREYSRTQEISDVVNYLRYDGLIVPCARYECRNLIIYVQNLAGDCVVEEGDSKVFEWSS